MEVETVPLMELLLVEFEVHWTSEWRSMWIKGESKIMLAGY